ncbi:hypothetical protein [Paenibacillus sp. PDC88]|uniref:hypothetical protein n=1 Tax=Paenibacillus sp. PDC88 TaxID=1884375 RepID=UPI00089B0EFD|nr:hypothetical protein [Paenibacillus sp. PDC88]SDX41247.1 hypothetical protein SAMN05518848_10760 [Paenibacillus sp. PDC88]
MLTIEEYLSRRKKEDQLNEFSLEARMENMKTCVNYVFEYFNQYLDVTKMEEQTVLNDERLEKYKKTIAQYDIEIQEWLINIYDEYNKQLNRSIISFLKKDELFYLYSSDSEFRSSSYECYAQLVKKNPFLKDQTEMLFLFIKDYHQVQSQPNDTSNRILISDEVDLWIDKTWKKHKIDVFAFCSDWVHRFYDNETLWPVSHRIKSKDSWRKYEYDIKQKSNLFNLNLLYKRVSDKPFIKGKKQYLEMVMMYYWLHDLVGDEEDYWQEYLNKCLNRNNSRSQLTEDEK